MFAPHLCDAKVLSSQQQAAGSGKGQGNALCLEFPSRSTEALTRKGSWRFCLHSTVYPFLTSPWNPLLPCGHLGGVFCPHKTYHPCCKEGKTEKGGHQSLRTEWSPPCPALGDPGPVIHPFSMSVSSLIQGRWGFRPSKLLSGLTFFDCDSTALGESDGDVGATS